MRSASDEKGMRMAMLIAAAMSEGADDAAMMSQRRRRVRTVFNSMTRAGRVSE